MSSTTCAYCGRFSHMTSKWAESVHIDGATAIQGAAKCDHCGRASLGVSFAPAQATSSGAIDRFQRTSDETIEWVPRLGVSPEFPDVPAHVALAAKEAHSAASINAVMAAILMARTVVEATAKEKSITSGSLMAKIDAMAANGHIRDTTKDAAHEIRHFGNDMAHGDIKDRPSADDVDEVLSLMDEVLNEVFQGPAKTARIKAKRTTAPTT